MDSIQFGGPTLLVKVLPSGPTEPSYFTELADAPYVAMQQIGQIVHGAGEIVKTQTLVDIFGHNEYSGMPLVVMVVNSLGQRAKLPINEKASQYYPNEYGIPIRGNAVLTGYEFVVGDTPDDVGYDIATMPSKWKVIHDMETAFAEDQDDSDVHKRLDELLLSVTDPDVRKMYEEARGQLPFWWFE